MKLCVKQFEAVQCLAATGLNHGSGVGDHVGRRSAKCPAKLALKPDLQEQSKEGKWPKKTVLLELN